MILYRATLGESTADIDPSKVLIVVNSNATTSSLSIAGADAYGALRGIPAGNRLLFDMGTTRDMSSAAIATLRTAIQAAVVANDYEAVLFSLATPLYMTGDTTGDGASLPDLATRFNYDESTASVVGRTNTPAVWVAAGAFAMHSRARDRFCAHPKNVTARTVLQPPHGRIGFPLFLDTSLVNESISLMQARVADAIEAENSRVWANSQWIVSIHERVSQVAYHCAEALAVLRENGLSPAFWYNTLSNGILDGGGSVVEGPQTPPSGTPWGTHANVVAGNVPSIQYLGYCGAALANATGQTDSFSPMPGAISCEWTSFSYVTGHELVLKGACSYVSAFSEPYANHVPYPERFVMGLLHGISLCELNNTTEHSQFVAVGDPLYAPYRNLRRTTWVM